MAPIFSEKGSSKLVMEPPEFVCDVKIGDSIEEPLPNTSFFMGIIGSAGSGKTSLLVNLLTMKGAYERVFDHVHMICPKNSMNSLKKDIWDGHPADKIHNRLDFGLLNDLHRKCKERASTKPKPEFTLVIIDDMTVHLKTKDIEMKLREMIYNRRHLRMSVMILVQSYNAMPLSLRKTLSHFALFKPRNKKEAEAIWEELMFVDKKTGNGLLKFVFQNDHDFLLGNSATGAFYRNFNEVQMHGEDDGFLVDNPGKRKRQEDDDSSSCSD